MWLKNFNLNPVYRKKFNQEWQKQQKQLLQKRNQIPML